MVDVNQDCLGPNSVNAVTSRPDESTVAYPNVSDTWVKDCDTATGKGGTRIQQFFLNKLLAQTRRVIRYFGITVDNSDDDMMRKAIERAVLVGRGFRVLTLITSTANFTVPDGITRLYVKGKAGGGAGGSWSSSLTYGGCGAEGGEFEGFVAVTPGDIIACTIGVGGVGKIAGAGAPGAAGLTSFGAYATALGGGPGSAQGDLTLAGGIGGGATPPTGGIARPGQDGTDGGTYVTSPASGSPGVGGGQGGGRAGTSAGRDANGDGAGGGGAGQGLLSGSGKPGYIAIWY